MANKDEGEKVVVQHQPKHLTDEKVFDPRHPAASSFAPLQPAAGVVADDADERGQNLRGGPKASEAHEEHRDQYQILADQAGVVYVPVPTKVEETGSGTGTTSSGRSSSTVKDEVVRGGEAKATDKG